MKRNEKLYNVLFPFWMLMLFPQMWLIVLPGNFVIDSIVLVLSLKMLRLEEKKAFYKRNILKIFLIGMLSDIIGAACMLAATIAGVGTMGDELYLTVPSLLVSSVLIYVLNFYITFKNLETKTRIKMSLIFAAVTAPYTFLIPSAWLYGY